MFVSVRILYENDRRRSAYWIKAQQPAVGWLVISPPDAEGRKVAKLVDDMGREMIPELRDANVVECKGRDGMLIIGRQYRRKGRKDAHVDQQRWWVHAPPEPDPYIDHYARVREAELEFIARGQGFPD